ncbi:septation protein SepH [Georgenia sunbinii]|uniref:septation protein SepH n=1 Tax=Georgenia sunbinii TaxID=3117728 RepID=UPI002F267855
MLELELVGLHGDGESLTLAGPDGQRYQLRLDDALRAAVRRDRPQMEQIRAGQAPLRPKDIQARIRAGATAAEVAHEAGLPIEHVQRYEGPVVAERQWVTEQARRFTIGHGGDAPLLGDLVVDRLATREVDHQRIEWDAVRGSDRTWVLVLRFTAGDRDRTARWQVDLGSRSSVALDDESRWLSETEVAPARPAARRHLSPVRPYDVEADGDVGPAIAAVDADLAHDSGDDDHAFGDLPAASTDDLLAELRANRGTRHDVEDALPEDDPLTLWDMPPAAHPPASRSHEATDAHVFPLPRGARPITAETPAAEPAKPTEPAAPAEPTPPAAERSGAGEEPSKRRRTSRSRRASVPSWDEIVFGAKPD